MAKQAGVISRTQATSLYLTPGSVRGLLQRHEWLEVHPGVYRSSAVPPAGFDTRVWAAALWLGSDAVVTGAAAATWWRLTEQQPAVVEVTVPPGRNPRSGRGVKVVRRLLDRADVSVHRGLRVADRPFAAVFGAAALGAAGQSVLDRALQRGVTHAQAAAVLTRNPRATGSRLGRLWTAAAQDATASESERRLASLFRRAGISGWQINQWVLTATGWRRADFLFAAAGLLVEVDGWAHHTAPDRFADDRHRQNQLVLQGWIVLRFTWHDITKRPERVVAEVRAALCRRR